MICILEVHVGSRKPDLQHEVVELFNLALTFQVHLEPSWIAREHDQCTEYLSIIVFGTHLVDRFASHYKYPT